MLRVGYSTKQSHEGPSLAVVRRIVERYGGMVFPEFGPETIPLIAQIPFLSLAGLPPPAEFPYIGIP